ncbi:pantetheine-phosphate adenylyltransferase [Candidatus Aerophobetes bacterium]|uniref:Phosphopantetheine adenylyltransferase n=1 Tax=Aerophobetes bacterium TaxID=2030807 RepID=A0A523S586_UNCAE|nr:MAG: pantetheine-phosphate adenylyltransferase [Candidatus Aerophobetes bacterium]
MSKIAIYPGSFDPITNGHLDIIKRARSLFDKVIITVNNNPLKTFLFTAQERVEMIKELFNVSEGIEVESFRGLLVQYAKKKRARFIIRGLRALSDFEYEFQMDLMNRKLNPGIQTIYLMTNQRYSYLSSGIIKEIVRLGGSAEGLIPDLVEKKLLEKFT